MEKTHFYRLVLTITLGCVITINGCKTTETAQVESSVQTEQKTPPPPPPSPPKVTKAPTPAKAIRRDDAGMLSVNKTNLDFGQIEPRAKVHGEYILTNTGKKTLEIEKVGKSCGCTVPKLETKILKPGQSIPLKITFNASDKPGKVTKKVWINTKAPHKPAKLNMSITAEVIKFLEANPERLNLVIKDQPQTMDLTLKCLDNRAFKITGFTCTNNAINVTYDEAFSGTEHKLKLDVNNSKMREAIAGNLIIKTSHHKAKTATISYRAARPFVAKPATKYFRNLTRGQSSTGSVTIISSNKVDFELGDISSSQGLIEVLKTEKTKDGYRVDFSLNVPDDRKPGRIQDRLNIAIKDYPKDSVRFTCYGKIQ